MPRRPESDAAAGDLDLLAGTLGEWVVAGGGLLVATDVDGALGAPVPGPAGWRLPADILVDLLGLARGAAVRAAVVSRDGLAALRALVPFDAVIRLGLDGREVEGPGLELAAGETAGADWDRGRAVLWALSQVAPRLRGPLKTLYLGAGLADETAFAVLAGRAATVRVGPPDPRSRASFRLDTPLQARRLLGALARAAGGRRAVASVPY